MCDVWCYDAGCLMFVACIEKNKLALSEKKNLVAVWRRASVRTSSDVIAGPASFYPYPRCWNRMAAAIGWVLSCALPNDVIIDCHLHVKRHIIVFVFCFLFCASIFWVAPLFYTYSFVFTSTSRARCPSLSYVLFFKIIWRIIFCCCRLTVW